MLPEFFELEGERVRLRPFSKDDIQDEYLGWLNNPSVVRYSNQRFKRHSYLSALNYFESFKGTPNRFLKITLKESNERMIGTVTVHHAIHHGVVNVGILIGDEGVWGRGLGQDSWNTTVNWLSADPHVRKVTAGAMGCNTAMIRLIQRSGMELEAVRVRHEILDGTLQDVVWYRLFCGD